MGCVPARKEFLTSFARRLHGENILLIFDEVMTDFVWREAARRKFTALRRI
jgi:glutamate-1-semialdehyde aminotransferase